MVKRETMLYISVLCGPGNFFRYTDATNTTMNAICDDCPLGAYQDDPGQSSCKQCASTDTTELTGSYVANDCKSKSIVMMAIGL